MGQALVPILEAIYAVERPAQAWLGGILDEARPALDQGLGLFAYFYDTRGSRFTAGEAILRGDCPLTPAILRDAFSEVSVDYVQNSWRAVSCGTASEIEGWNGRAMRRSRSAFHTVGVADVLCINGFDPGGVGCSVAVPLSGETRMSARKRLRLTRVARHLASAFRVRQRIGGRFSADCADAIFTPGGRLVHADGEARDASARQTLREAIVALDRLRASAHREDEDSALSHWRVRVRARWSLIDAFESDGRRYVLAVANEPEPNGPDALSEREKQVLTYAALGQSNKMIAYELGLSASTIRVLVSRAAAKLGARRREEAIALFRASTSKA